MDPCVGTGIALPSLMKFGESGGRPEVGAMILAEWSRRVNSAARLAIWDDTPPG